MMFIRFAALALALTLSACAAVATNDINTAITLATKANDAQGLKCLQAQQIIYSVNPPGIFTVMEQARLSQNAAALCSPQLR